MLNARTLPTRRKAHSGSSGGGGSPAVSLENFQPYSTYVGNGGNGNAALAQFNPDGTITINDPAISGALPGNWLSGGGSGADYQIRADIVSGTVSGSATGSWLSLASLRSWAKGGVYYVHSALINVRIRRASDFVELDSCLVALTYEGEEYGGGGGFA